MIAGLWHRDVVGWMIVAALLPVAAVALVEQGASMVFGFGIALVVIALWQVVFLITRAQPLSPIALVTAFAVALLAPGTMEAWQLVIAVTFGSVIGEQIFGGWGRNLLHAGVVTLSFLYFAFPEIQHPGTSAFVALAVLPGALLLMATGIVSWQMIFASIAGLVGVTLALGQDVVAPFLEGSLIFGLVFLGGDPVTSAATRGGRWIYGFLCGALIALFGWADTGIAAPQAVVFAVRRQRPLARQLVPGVGRQRIQFAVFIYRRFLGVAVDRGAAGEHETRDAARARLFQ